MPRCDPVYDIHASGGYLYILTDVGGDKGVILRTGDLDVVEFEVVANAPDDIGAVSMTLLGGRIYLGTVESNLYATDAA